MENINQPNNGAEEIPQAETVSGQGRKNSMLKVLTLAAALASVPAIAEAGARTDLDCGKAEKILALNNSRQDLKVWAKKVCDCAATGRLGRAVGTPKLTQSEYNDQCGPKVVSMTAPAAPVVGVTKPSQPPTKKPDTPTVPPVTKPPKKPFVPPTPPIVPPTPPATPDAGVQLDAGVDAGVPADAGVQLDAGVPADGGGEVRDPKKEESGWLDFFAKHYGKILLLLLAASPEVFFRKWNKFLEKEIIEMADWEEKEAKKTGLKFKKPDAIQKSGLIPYYGSISAWSKNMDTYKATCDQGEKILKKGRGS